MTRGGHVPIERDSSKYAFVDVEVGLKDRKVHDIGAVRNDGANLHSASKRDLENFLQEVNYLCGHNIINHDIKYLWGDKDIKWCIVDTLPISPLLFPDRPYHHLLKDDKLICDQLNNPVNDCEKARDLLMDEISQWEKLPQEKKLIYATLLHDKKEFSGFISFVHGDVLHDDLVSVIKRSFRGKICENSDLRELIKTKPCELAYALALIDTTDERSITPGWVLHNYPMVEFVVKQLRHTQCSSGCPYCNTQLDLHANLKMFFGYDQFRTYEGEPLQERAAQAASDGESLLAIFPTGGGKSLTFQLPALMAGRSVHGLTVVISPLQSLMKDQVDNLVLRGIDSAVTINGLLDPIERAKAIQRVLSGDASLLYIAPEMLRSKTIENILLARHVVRFVIDEAHCFSSWGQDFRVDYLYIGKFIREYQKKKGVISPIPVSCFTATAKQKVVQDIRDYFNQTLNLDLVPFFSTASRTNLRYSVIHAENDDDKYAKLRSLIVTSDSPTIVYVSRTKRTKQLAERLSRDGYQALPFNGRMESDEKVANQNAFMTDQVRIIVATSAFGMGVDKSDVGLVIHYDISESLENYVQEAGRAGRDPHLQARCYVLYSDEDLDKHFILLNQTKLSISEIQQVWKAVKDLTKQRPRVSCSALEIARQAGWDDSVPDIEMRVKTALQTLEQGGYLERGNNIPHVYATGITVNNVDEARQRISNSLLFSHEEVDNAVRIIQSLIHKKHTHKMQNEDAESRIDYLADLLGMTKKTVISVVERMRQEGILADSKDLSAYVVDGATEHKSNLQLDRFAKLEKYILEHHLTGEEQLSYKQLNEEALNAGIATSSEKDVRTLLHFLTIGEYIRKKETPGHSIQLSAKSDLEKIQARFHQRIEICRFTTEWLYGLMNNMTEAERQKKVVQFSIVELLNQIKTKNSLFGNFSNLQLEEVEEAILYLSKIGALKLEGGFLVIYNAMDIRRLQENNIRYKQSDYKLLNEFYKQKIQQVHIVGEYANLMVRDYNAALQYVQDYFQMDYKHFISKYFKGNRITEIERNVTPQKYNKIYGNLSRVQTDIIQDTESRCIVVAAGPGSGKTRVLVHKLASLLQLEDVKHEQLLMLTFSRAAATEFKQRLIQLTGNAAQFVEIKTFHSYCFDLLGRIGNIESAHDVVAQAAELIERGEVEVNKIRKTALVIDEAQDMDEHSYRLVKALMDNNEDLRVIAVGDDDQNIYSFRGSDSKYLRMLTLEPGRRFVEMVENYRSSKRIVEAANLFARNISERMKSTPAISKLNNDGFVQVIHHASSNLYIPLVNQFLQNRSGGVSGILTKTNEEAAIIHALLKKYGIRSKIIQSMDNSFRFSNLAEIRYFLSLLKNKATSPLISDEVWKDAKNATSKMYAQSTCMEYIERCWSIFEKTSRAKYLTDFKEFVYESSVEDFCNLDKCEVVISTIHKSKGREFDDVYMLVTDKFSSDDDRLRQYYVALTRAKHRLFIHSNSNFFNRLTCADHVSDKEEYNMPSEVVLQLSHRDVNLDFFKSIPRKKEILGMRAGDELTYADGMMRNAKGEKVVYLSQNMLNNVLPSWQEKGYYPKSAITQYIVAWKSANSAKSDTEYAVLLSDLLLEKRESGI